jgi:RNA polymerase-binding transcription factor DksA
MTRTTLPRQPEISAEQIALHRVLLEQQRQFRVEQIAELRRPTAGPQTSADAEVVTSLLSGARAALHDIRAALRRIDDGSYGRCTSCGGRVGVARLEILPHAARCLSCEHLVRSG